MMSAGSGYAHKATSSSSSFSLLSSSSSSSLSLSSPASMNSSSSSSSSSSMPWPNEFHPNMSLIDLLHTQQKAFISYAAHQRWSRLPVGSADLVGMLADLPLQNGVDLSFYDSTGATTMMIIFRKICVYHGDYSRSSEKLSLIRPNLPHLIQSLTGMDVNHADANDHTLLHVLLMDWIIPKDLEGDIVYTLVQGVLDAGGDPLLVTSVGRTSLMLTLQRHDYRECDKRYPTIFKALRCQAGYLMKVTDATTGDSHLHVIIQNWKSHQMSALIEYVLSEYCHHGGDMFAANYKGETIFSLIATRLSEKPDDLDNQISSQLLTYWLSGWQSQLAPCIGWMISHYLPNDLSGIIVEYIDGSGKPFDPTPTNQ